MSLEPIRRNHYLQPDRAWVQESTILAVETNPDYFIQKYVQDSRSFEGRYVAADLFKETFDVYSDSKETRNRYNGPVHNSAAVLSAEQFRRVLADNSSPEKDTVVFLTGIPGAGKTSSVISGGKIPDNFRMIFEGQLSNSTTTLEKISQVVEANLKCTIIAVHAQPEDALKNTLTRFEEIGRGASIHVMSSIQGNLPDSLEKVLYEFGQAVEFKVYDFRDRRHPAILEGWNHLDVIRSEGNDEHIKNRLNNSLEQLHKAGTLSDAAYRQARGDDPLELSARLGESYSSGRTANDGRGRFPTEHIEKPLVNSTSLTPATSPYMAGKLSVRSASSKEPFVQKTKDASTVIKPKSVTKKR